MSAKGVRCHRLWDTFDDLLMDVGWSAVPVLVEHTGASGADTLTADVLGVDVAGRVGEAVTLAARPGAPPEPRLTGVVPGV